MKNKTADVAAAPEPQLQIGSAADYAKTRERAQQEGEIIPVPMPTGFVWGLRRPDVAGFIMTGRMPQSLVEEFLQSAKKRGKLPKDMTPEDLKAVADSVDLEETVNSLIFMRELVRETAASPRIVVGGLPENNEIDPSEIDPRDFKYIFHWAMSHKGVQGIDALQTFQSRRERRANQSRNRRKKLRTKAVATTKH